MRFSHLIIFLRTDQDDLFKAACLKFITSFLKSSSQFSENAESFQQEFIQLGLSEIIKVYRFVLILTI